MPAECPGPTFFRPLPLYATALTIIACAQVVARPIILSRLYAGLINSMFYNYKLSPLFLIFLLHIQSVNKLEWPELQAENLVGFYFVYWSNAFTFAGKINVF